MTSISPFTVYILKCRDQSYYTGFTNDLEKRLFEHQSGYYKGSYTFLRRPVELVFQYHFDNMKDALSFEKQIKGWRRDKKEALINGCWDRLPELSKSYGLKR